MNKYNGFGGALCELDICAVRYGENIFGTSESELMCTGFIYDERNYRINFLTESGEKESIIIKGKNLFSKIKELNAQGCKKGSILRPLHENE